MFTVQLWWHGKDNEHLGSWYDDEKVEVPRKGDILWLETNRHKLARWKVKEVQWSFRDSTHGIGHTRSIKAEVHVAPMDRPWLERVAMLFPRAATYRKT